MEIICFFCLLKFGSLQYCWICFWILVVYSREKKWDDVDSHNKPLDNWIWIGMWFLNSGDIIESHSLLSPLDLILVKIYTIMIWMFDAIDGLNFGGTEFLKILNLNLSLVLMKPAVLRSKKTLRVKTQIKVDMRNIKDVYIFILKMNIGFVMLADDRFSFCVLLSHH